MAITLFNPTKDKLSATYGGVTIHIPPFPDEGHMVRVDDNKGNHILNQLGPRGLTSLNYGDEGDAKANKAKDGRKRNHDFKRTQIGRYNRDNEGRKARQLEYVNPPDFIEEWAKELGVGIIAPYEVQDIKNEEISKMKAEAEVRDKQNAELQKQVAELMEMVKKVLPALETKEDKEKAEIDEIKAEIKKMNRNILKSWVEKLGHEEYSKYPIEIQEFIRERWEGFFDKEEAAFPL